MTEKELQAAKNWLEAHFDFIEYEKLVTIDEFMKDVQKMGKYDTLMIDPHNSFAKPPAMNGHEHDYQTAARLRLYAKKFNTTVYMCIHAATEALRKTHKSGDYEGLPMPPNAADAEGGGKWVNRADDFLVIHRYTQSQTSWMYTEVHVKKVKETETGGRPTFIDEPILFKLEYGTAFTCGGVNALAKLKPIEEVINNEYPF